MKEELVIKIRKNILEEVFCRLSKKEQEEFDEIVEDALMVYFNIKLNDINKNNEDNIIILDDVNCGNYVYVFMDPTIRKKTKTGIDGINFNYEPFYIGKGSGKRSEEPERNEAVNIRISHLKKNGVDPIILKIKEGISILQAYKLENYLINKIGRSDIGKGPLLNIDEGISFVDSDNVIYDFTDLNLEKNTNLMILDALNKKRTLKESAKILGISERTLYRKIQDLKIKKCDGKYSFT